MSCIVVGCKSHSSRKENDAKIISFHQFPSDVDMRQKLINAIARNNWEWKKQHRICSKHFSDDCFNNIGHKWRRLKIAAVPSLHLRKEEFMSTEDVTGKVTIDFRDANSLRILTKCLLKADFNLDVDIPEDRLVPTLPLRLNYILWVEDLLNAIKRNDEIKGLDIGTGACAIYPLLAAAKNKWQMMGTETDSESFKKAEENIQRNNLQHLITLRRNTKETIIKHVFVDEEKSTYDFCMCNPPFYSNIQELYESRSPARLPPKNGFTGSPQELITKGGELEFCRKLIEESKVFKNNIMIFTTMVGHKYNLSMLLQDLKSGDIRHTHTEFCQGHVTRWGLAWTYKEYDLYRLVPSRDKSRKKHAPTVYLLPELPNCIYNIETAFNKIKELLDNLKISHKLLNKRGSNVILDVRAQTNTWSNQRRKRRLQKRMETEIKKPKMTPKLDEITSESSGNDNALLCEYVVEGAKLSCGEIMNVNSIELNVNNKTSENNSQTLRKHELEGPNNSSGEEMDIKTIEDDIKDSKFERNNATLCEHSSDEKMKHREYIINEMSENFNATSSKNELETKNQSCDVKNTNQTSLISKDDYDPVEISEGSSKTQPIVHAFLKLLKKDKEILLELEFLDGSAGKEGLHQIMQYIKNNWQ